MSFFRRAGALIARFFTSAVDPSAATGEFQLYSKEAGGQSQLFGRSDDGSIYQITPPGGGGGDTSAANVLTFRPGGTDTGPIVFNDFDALYAQLLALRTAADESGLFKIVFDDVNDLYQPVNIPNGATYDMDRAEWVGTSQGSTTWISLLGGAGQTLITNLLNISGVAVCRKARFLSVSSNAR